MKSFGSFNLKAIGLFSICSCRKGILKSLCESADSRRRDLVKLPHIKERNADIHSANISRIEPRATKRTSAFCLADLASERAKCRGAKMERAVTRSHWPTNGTKSSGSVNVPAWRAFNPLVQYPPLMMISTRSPFAWSLAKNAPFQWRSSHTGERRKLSTTLNYAMRILTLIRL